MVWISISSRINTTCMFSMIHIKIQFNISSKCNANSHNLRISKCFHPISNIRCNNRTISTSIKTINSVQWIRWTNTTKWARPIKETCKIINKCHKWTKQNKWIKWVKSTKELLWMKLCCHFILFQFNIQSILLLQLNSTISTIKWLPLRFSNTIKNLMLLEFPSKSNMISIGLCLQLWNLIWVRPWLNPWNKLIQLFIQML
jgi:hypothetical protein